MRIIMLVLLLMVARSGNCQEENFWHVLARVSFSRQKDANGYEVEKPLFSKYLKSFRGKTVRLKGYVIPVSEAGGKGTFMLSLLPFNVCYFCGAAGPETVIEVECARQIKFTTKQITMEGLLSLNDSDPDHHIYILTSASLIEL